MTNQLGSWVKANRERLNLSTRELGAMLGKSGGYISTLENGKIGLPGADVRRRLAEVFGVRHIDVLIAAGEINPEEVELPDIPEDVRASLEVGLLNDVWHYIDGHPNREGLLRMLIDQTRGTQ